MKNKHRSEFFVWLAEMGFQLHRESGKHYVFRDSVSQFVCAKTPGDRMADHFNRSIVKRLVRKREEIQAAEAAKLPKEEPMNDTPRRVIVNPGPQGYKTEAPPIGVSLGEIASMHKPKIAITPAPRPEEDAKYPFTIRYDPKKKELIELRLVELIEHGASLKEMTRVLNLEGHRAADGTEFKDTTVRNLVTSLKLKLGINGRDEAKAPPAPEKPSQVAAAPSPAPVAPPVPAPAVSESKTLPRFVLEILKNPDLSDSKKVRMLLVYADE